MADLIYRNGTILTLDPGQPQAAALAVSDSRILAVGSDAEIAALRTARTRVLDLAGACVLPGFHDAHVHLTGFGLQLGHCDLTGAASPDEALALLAAHQDEGAGWLFGTGFPLASWTDAGRVTAAALDEVTGERPALLRSQDLHSAWLNSAALRELGFTVDSQDPAGGKIIRDEAGNPSGLLLERAAVQAQERLPEASGEQLRAALQAAAGELARLGITTVHHMAMESAAHWRQLALQATQDEFPVRVWACIDQEHIEAAAQIGVATGQGHGNFTIGGAKFFVDGALGSRTALMLEPYEGTAERGVMIHGPDVLNERVPLAIAAGLTPVAHAIGDAACRMLLDVLETTESQWREQGLRPRLEHAQHLQAEDLARLARLGVTASMQPIHLTFDAAIIPSLLGSRADRAFVTRELLTAGVPLAFGSDVPVAPPDVLAGLRAAVNRQGADGQAFQPEQALSVMEALAAYTTGAARAIGRENSSGRLTEGFYADLVVLSADPRSGLEGLEVLQTVKGGRVTHDAGLEGGNT